MNDRPPGDARRLIAALAEEARADAGIATGNRVDAGGDGAHPSADELLAYHEGALEPAAEERVRDHLVACRACTRRLLDLAVVAAPDEPVAGNVHDLATAASWRELQSRLAAESAARPASPTAARAARPPWATRLLGAVAAVFLIAALGLSVQVARLGAPEAGVPSYVLNPPEVRGESMVRIEIPAGRDRFDLRLTPSRSFDRYRLEFLAGDRVVQVWDDLERDANGNLTFSLRRRHLPAGDYRVRLFGLRDGESVPLEEDGRRLRVVHR